MTPPPLSIGSLVDVTGPDCNGDTSAMNCRIKVTQKWESRNWYSARGYQWYPASSLRLVEELKIGDWVEVVGPTRTGGNHDIGGLFRISAKTLSGEYEGANDWSGKNFGWYPTKNLRKLTPEEVKRHTSENIRDITATLKLDTSEFGEAMKKVESYESPATKELRRRIHDLEMSLNGFTNGPGPEYVPGISYVKHPVRDRLDAIESRLDNIGSSHAELMTDVEALAERAGAMQKSIDILEGIQRGEEPEVCEGKRTCDEEDCRPFPYKINVSIWVGEEAHTNESTCPNELIDWCEKVLNAMRNGGA